MGAAGLGEEGVEAGLGRDDAHVAGRGLGHQARDPLAVLGEDGRHGVAVVVGQHQREGGRRLGHARRPGHGERRQPGAGRGQQRVDVAVVAAGELHDDVATGGAAREPDRRHGGLGPGGDEPDPLDRRARHDLLAQGQLGLGRGAVRRAAGDRGLHGRLDLGVGVAEDHRPPGADQVDVAAAVDVGEVGPGRPVGEAGGAADGPERAHGRVDPARQHGAGALEEGGGGGGVERVEAHRPSLARRAGARGPGRRFRGGGARRRGSP